MKLAPVLWSALGLAACQPAPSVQTTAAQREMPGFAMAQQHCASCHAVERYGDSTNPNAPPFARVVNQPGLTRETLSWWLRDAHNYPQEMRFDLDPLAVAQLTDYMLTLRDPDYRPPI